MTLSVQQFRQGFNAAYGAEAEEKWSEYKSILLSLSETMSMEEIAQRLRKSVDEVKFFLEA